MRGFIVGLAALSLSACAQVTDAVKGAPPSEVEAIGEMADTKMPALNTVQQNITFANTLIRLYDDRSGRLRDADYYSTLPLYAAAVASGAMLLNNVNHNILLKVGAGAAGYYAGLSSLDFDGRAEVLEGATGAWQCFSDAAARVDFLDPATPPPAGTKPQLGVRLQHDYELLDRTIRKARAYLSNGTPMDDATRTALIHAVDAANTILPSAERVARQATQADLILAKQRRAILRAVSIAYRGKRQPFNYQSVLNGTTTAVDHVLEQRSAAGQSNDKLAQLNKDALSQDLPAETRAADGGANAGESRTQAFSAYVNGVTADRPDSRKLRAIAYILAEMTERFSYGLQAKAVSELPLDLAKCTP